MWCRCQPSKMDARGHRGCARLTHRHRLVRSLAIKSGISTGSCRDRRPDFRAPQSYQRYRCITGRRRFSQGSRSSVCPADARSHTSHFRAILAHALLPLFEACVVFNLVALCRLRFLQCSNNQTRTAEPDVLYLRSPDNFPAVVLADHAALCDPTIALRST